MFERIDSSHRILESNAKVGRIEWHSRWLNIWTTIN